MRRSKEEKEKLFSRIVEMWDMGYSYDTIRIRFKCGKRLVKEALDAAGSVSRRKNPSLKGLPEEREEQLQERSEEQLSQSRGQYLR